MIVVSPEGGKVEKDSVTTVTAKVKHKIEGNELDKPVEATFGSGVKSIDPAGEKQKSPATFTYTAGSKAGDRGDVSFESISNRGIGRTFVTFCVACADWTINSVGTSNEQYDVAGLVNELKVSIDDLRVTVGTDSTLTGSGMMKITGRVSLSYPGAIGCDGQLDQTNSLTVRGTLVGKRAESNDRTIGPPMLKLTVYAPSDPSAMVALTCRIPGTGAQTTVSIGAQGFSERYGEAVGEFDVPADGGTKTVTNTAAIGGLVNVRATGTFTVVAQKR